VVATTTKTTAAGAAATTTATDIYKVSTFTNPNSDLYNKNYQMLYERWNC
jgi:hypothetical protein